VVVGPPPTAASYNHIPSIIGAAIKTGARHASGDILLFMDADGQHQPEDAARLIDAVKGNHDMAVGMRSPHAQANIFRRLANAFYNWLASRIVGHEVRDLTSGMRAVRADLFREFLYLLPNGFSYPTTITMVFFRAGYKVTYEPIDVKKRVGKSHLRLLHDGFRFMVIIFKIGTLYSPLKLFTPLAGMIFLLGMGYYGYTYVTDGRFTNMSALLLTLSVLTFLIGLVSEQVTTVLYALNEKDRKRE
jgi:glycosyltransferase involved in cell wall biosynthesis